MSILDLKMNRQLGSTLTLHSEEVTSVDINEAENSLVAGFKDGIIKIFNITSNYEVRETYSAFSQVGNKKGGVS
jgi:WD40 repeat protein